jgi:type I restriction enzyme S subunit
LDNGYKCYCFQNRDIKRQFLFYAVGTKVSGISKTNIAKIFLPVPPLAEQCAIAEALSDVDALIAALDKLIAKKRDLKQAAMQKLLTGNQRLPGFSGEWEVKRLGELAEIISGGTPKTSEASYWQGSIKWCTPTDITGCSEKYLVETERTISAAGLASCSAQLLPIGTLLLCSRATIGEVKIAGCEICTNQGFKSLVCKPGVHNEFLYYKLLTMKSKMIERAIGSTFLEISKKDTIDLELSIPEQAEQTAIAAVLSDMDAGIAALERKLDKIRALKQGMMQELLTGKTRLV